MSVNVIPDQKIVPAAAGNKALQELLKALADTVNQQQTVTGTAGRNAPPQAKATVTYQSGSYIVEIQNPGSQSYTSTLQSAQNTALKTAADTVQPVTALFHQIRCATSPRFSISDNVQTFGGDTGSTQTLWTLSQIASGQHYFQIRSSYNGTDWNLWRNANGGKAINTSDTGVTLVPAANCLWATISFPGSQVVGFGAGQGNDGDSFGLPESLLSGSMVAIAGQNGFIRQEDHVSHGVALNAVTLQVPIGATATLSTGYPTRINQKYEDGEGNIWTGSASVFAFAFSPFGPNQTVYAVDGGMWVVFTLPGGAQLAIGGGKLTVGNDGAPMPRPSALSWITLDNLVGIVSPNTDNSPDHQARGYYKNGFFAPAVGGDPPVIQSSFRDNVGDSGNHWGDTANWFAVAYSNGYPTQMEGGGKFLVIQLDADTTIAIGGAQAVASGTEISLPSGFSEQNMLAIATPFDTTNDGDPTSGIRQCSFVGLVPFLIYEDSEGHQWSGNLNWMTFLWK